MGSQDQGGRMRTLGLSPHFCLKNLEALSDRVCESVTDEIKKAQDPSYYELDRAKEVSYAPKTYEEIDYRSRFRIISTSPSLNPRITVNSCV
jgi:hypothetical protein